MGNHIRTLMVATAVCAIAGIAYADSHFITASDSIDSAGNLTANWKEAGLGNCAPSCICEYVLSATVSSTWQCFNGGNNQPQGQPFKLPPSNGSAPGGFAPTHNGTITASLTLSPDPDDLSCGKPPFKLCLTAVSYTNVTLTDTTVKDSTPLSPQQQAAQPDQVLSCE